MEETKSKQTELTEDRETVLFRDSSVFPEGRKQMVLECQTVIEQIGQRDDGDEYRILIIEWLDKETKLDYRTVVNAESVLQMNAIQTLVKVVSPSVAALKGKTFICSQMKLTPKSVRTRIVPVAQAKNQETQGVPV